MASLVWSPRGFNRDAGRLYSRLKHNLNTSGRSSGSVKVPVIAYHVSLKSRCRQPDFQNLIPSHCPGQQDINSKMIVRWPIPNMKWLYFSLGIIGFLAPTGVLYAVNFDRRVPGAIIDLGLLFYSVGLSILFIPLGMGAGLVLALVIHFVWNRRPGRTDPRAPLRPRSSSAEGPRSPNP